jgi:ElaB/YqjD/DUF883 family membrane-anchored ribosome-binding protein
VGEDEGEGGSPVSEEERGPEEIRQEIEETREELGETVNALSERADVKSQAQDKVSELKGTIAGKADEAKDKAQTATPDAFDVEQAGVKARQAAGAAQENPAALAGGAFLLGLLIGRRLGRRSA